MFKNLNRILLIILIISFIPTISGYAENTKKKKPAGIIKAELVRGDNSSTVVAKVGKEEITLGEIEKAFKKNMNRKDMKLSDVNRDSLLDFVNLYLNYRLKVADAIKRGYENDSSVKADIAQNRKLLSENYFYDKLMIQPWLNRMLDYRKFEYKIGIIVVGIPSRTNQEDTTEAWTKAKKVLDDINSKKETFESMAKTYSDDKESGKNGGVIPAYITSGSIQRPIEEKIYTLETGQVYPELIRTRYGYFILKLIEKQPRYLVRGKHILLTYKPDTDSASVNKKADNIISELNAGANFEELAKKYSEDKVSAEKGGDFGGYYSRSSGFEDNSRKLVGEFEDALFNLKNGEKSGKVLSEYGIHLIMRDTSKQFDPDKERNSLRMIYKRLYFDEDKQKLSDSLEVHYKFYMYESVLKDMIPYLDTNKTNLENNWGKKIPDNIKIKVLFSVSGKETTVADFANLMNTKNDLRGLGLNAEGIHKAIKKIIQPIVFEEATKNLENEYPDFNALMKEFRDGILLFKVEAIEVWDKLKFDTVSAQKYWEPIKEKFKTMPLYDLSEIYVLDDSVAQALYKRIQSGEDFATIAKVSTQRETYREKGGSWGKVNSKDNKLAKIAEENKLEVGKVLYPQKHEKGWSIIKLNGFEPIRQKTFTEAISDFAPEFQDITQKKLTNDWLERIRTENKVEFDKKDFEKAINK